MSPHFERVAREVSRRASELLCAHTYVLDERDVVVATSDPDALGLPLKHNQNNDTGSLQVPLRVGGHTGQVVVGETLNGELVSPRLAQVVVELVINQTAIVDDLPSQHELKHKFIHDLLRGALTDEETILRQARILGMDLGPPRAVILIDASRFILGEDGGSDEDHGQAARRAQIVIGSVVSFFRLPNDTICAYIGEGEVAVLKASDTKNLANWAEEGEQAQQGASWANLAALKRAGNALLARLRSDTSTSVSIGLGRYHRGVLGLARSYQDARTAMSLGRRLSGENHVHCLDGLGIAAFVGVADERTKLGLATNLLSPLDAEPELLHTLETFFDEDCRPLATSKRLRVHRNTLTYRLDKIQLLTGIDARCFDHAVQMRLAMLLRTMQPAESQLPL